jgi:hypothetical protein
MTHGATLVVAGPDSGPEHHKEATFSQYGNATHHFGSPHDKVPLS